MLLAVDQAGRADEGRLHALDDGVAGKLGADRLAHHRARAVAADQEAAIDPPAPCRCRDRAVTRWRNCPPPTTSSTEMRLRMVMRGCAAACSNRIGSRKIWLMRCGGSGVGQLQSAAVFRGEAVAAAGNPDARQLLARERGAIADVVRIVGRQPGIADLLGDAEPPEDLHGARGDMVAFRLGRRGAGARLHHGHVDAAPGEIDREREPDRSGADDQNIGASLIPASAPEFFTMVGPAIDLGLDVVGKTVRRRSPAAARSRSR